VTAVATDERGLTGNYEQKDDDTFDDEAGIENEERYNPRKPFMPDTIN
jgi:hypothetical protein